MIPISYPQKKIYFLFILCVHHVLVAALFHLFIHRLDQRSRPYLGRDGIIAGGKNDGGTT